MFEIVFCWHNIRILNVIMLKCYSMLCPKCRWRMRYYTDVCNKEAHVNNSGGFQTMPKKGKLGNWTYDIYLCQNKAFPVTQSCFMHNLFLQNVISKCHTLSLLLLSLENIQQQPLPPINTASVIT